jgi:signal transduction histidine kinase
MTTMTVNASQNTSQKDVVLIIDDNPTNLGVVVESLEESGFKIIIARNGEMGIKRAQFVKPDIILLDVVMPGISGFETCSRLKANKNTVDIPVIFMTALDNTEDKVKGFELGGVDYITKPVQVEEVLARLKTHLTIHKLKNVNQQNERLKQEIAKRKLVEEQLRQSKELAESANHAKSAFLANMSHELRTPLNGILGYTQILNRDQSLTEQQKKGIDIIHRSGEHLLTLINDILDLSKIEAGKLELMPTECNIRSFLKDIVDIFYMRAIQKGIQLEYKPLSELPSMAYVDEKRLRQVLLNLLSNAIKFTKTGQVSFRVHYKILTDEKSLISLEVEDSGEGIAADNLEKIFLPFQQVGEQSYHIEGTGLGLPISQKLVKMMGGELHVESQLNVGSRFWFSIPLTGCKQEIKDTHTDKLDIIGIKSNNLTILVVDDQKENRAVLHNILKPLGFNVIEAENGQEAINKAHDFKPNAIIMDIRMPIMDGLEATKLLRQDSQFSNTVIIALSANVFDYQQQQALDAGCNVCINKPIHIEEFLTQLGKYCELEWIYQTAEKTDIDTNEIIKPSSEEIKALFDIAKTGNVRAVIKQAQTLLEEKPDLKSFVDKVCNLAKSFNISELKRFLQ